MTCKGAFHVAAALLALEALGCACASSRTDRAIADRAPAPIRAQAPKVVVNIIHRQLLRGVVHVTARAILYGTPMNGESEWLCMAPEWWQDGGRRSVAAANEFCGELPPATRIWEHDFDLVGQGHTAVHVTLWSRAGKNVGQGGAEVALQPEG